MSLLFTIIIIIMFHRLVLHKMNATIKSMKRNSYDSTILVSTFQVQTNPEDLQRTVRMTPS